MTKCEVKCPVCSRPCGKWHKNPDVKGLSGLHYCDKHGLWPKMK